MNLPDTDLPIPALTASDRALPPRCFSSSTARSTAALVPAMTTWPPPLRFAGDTTAAVPRPAG